jgi:hypothetical protein
MAAQGAGPGRIKLNIAIDIANNAELRANAQEILALTRATRPKNTTLSYTAKQKEFQVRTVEYSILGGST